MIYALTIPQVKEFFDSFDDDGNGQLSTQEFIVMGKNDAQI
jgi:Ca2+-binding EF-hand superfamily protein